MHPVEHPRDPRVPWDLRGRGIPKGTPRPPVRTLDTAAARTAMMDCDRYLARYSDLRDGMAPAALADAMRAHRAACPRCARYDEVMGHGLRLVRDLPEIEISEDFGERLRHRLMHVDEEMAFERKHGTAGSATAALSIAAVLAAVAWLPLAGRAPSPDTLPLVMALPPASKLPHVHLPALPDGPPAEDRGLAEQLADLGVPVMETPYEHLLRTAGSGSTGILLGADLVPAQP